MTKAEQIRWIELDLQRKKHALSLGEVKPPATKVADTRLPIKRQPARRAPRHINRGR